MGFPDHLIMDFNFKKNNKTLPYWVAKFTSTKAQNPSFIDEISPNLVNNPQTPKVSWLSFLRDTKYSVNNTNNLLSTLHLLETTSRIPSLNNHRSSYSAENLININFLRYERLYTKLKYSRSPAFDIVSGGAAALLAGFVGFLISEKFGFELVDSGDFYYLFMYIVFGAFILKPLLYMSNSNHSILSTLSYRNFLSFFTKLTILFISKIKKLFI